MINRTYDDLRRQRYKNICKLTKLRENPPIAYTSLSYYISANKIEKRYPFQKSAFNELVPNDNKRLFAYLRKNATFVQFFSSQNL